MDQATLIRGLILALEYYLSVLSTSMRALSLLWHGELDSTDFGVEEDRLVWGKGRGCGIW